MAHLRRATPWDGGDESSGIGIVRVGRERCSESRPPARKANRVRATLLMTGGSRYQSPITRQIFCRPTVSLICGQPMEAQPDDAFFWAARVF